MNRINEKGKARNPKKSGQVVAKNSNLFNNRFYDTVKAVLCQ